MKAVSRSALVGKQAEVKRVSIVQKWPCEAIVVSGSEYHLTKYYLTKENTNGRFRQLALASRGGKRHKREGYHYSLSNLNKIKRKEKKKSSRKFKLKIAFRIQIFCTKMTELKFKRPSCQPHR